MRTLSIFWHTLAAIVLLAACDPGPGLPPGTEAMTAILKTMIEANQAGLPPDSLRAIRQRAFEAHGTDSTEVRAWIEAVRHDPGESARIAQRVAEALETSPAEPDAAYRADPARSSP